MVEIRQRLAVGFEIVVDKYVRLRRQTIFSHQVKFEPQVSECTKGLEEHQTPLALEVTPDEEDLDRTCMWNTWHWSAPFMHIHARGNDSNLIGRHLVTLHKAELCPLRPRNEPMCGSEAVAVQAPFPSLQPCRALLVLIECTQLVILERRGVERDDAGELAEPALGEDGRHLCVEEQGVKLGLS